MHDLSAALKELQAPREFRFFAQRFPMPEMATVDEIRRDNLRALVREFGGVGQVAAKVGVSDSQFSQWLNASLDFKSGKPRGMSPASCRRIEAKTGRPVGWLDQAHPLTIPVGLARETDTAIALGGVMSGPPGVAVDHTPRPPSLAEALEVVGMALAREMPERTRAELADALSAWARYAGRDRYRQTVTELLDGNDANSTGTHG